jgi:polyisoprenoid-binding protein YceI
MMRRADTRRAFGAIGALTVTLLTGSVLVAGDGADETEVRGGAAAFQVGTNIPAIRVHGKSKAVQGRASVRLTPDGLAIDELHASVPVQTLSTGMSLRDGHMRKYIFTAADGRLPDLEFSATDAVCTGSADRADCRLAGHLTIRGNAQPFTIVVVATRQDSGFRVVGESVVRLSSYGIEPPSQLGVRTDDEVKLSVDVLARSVRRSALFAGPPR